MGNNHLLSVVTIAVACMLPTCACRAASDGQELRIGWASVDITPSFPCKLRGQRYERIAQKAHDPLTATALALESASGDTQAVIVSVDLVSTFNGLWKEVRDQVAPRIPDFDPRNLFIAATHTHTGPYSTYPERIADAVVRAWEGRSPGGVSWQQGEAAIGYCRICKHADGSSHMYGDPTRPDFIGFEGEHDHRVNLLYTYDASGGLTGVVVNLACPSQLVEGALEVSADFWHPVRTQLRESVSEDLAILPLCSAAGDQSPRDLADPNRPPDTWEGTVTLGTRISDAVKSRLPAAEQSITKRLVFGHRVEDVYLTMKDSRGGGAFHTEVHAIRLGDIAFANNPFELYIGHGFAMKRRSRAAITFLAQLSGNRGGGYLPTQYASDAYVQAYGARHENGVVGPIGGRELVDHTVAMINSMFADVDHARADTDGDGADDAWELGRFGDLSHDGAGFVAAVAARDGDGDGATNLEKSAAGTDPNDRTDRSGEEPSANAASEGDASVQ